jgi:type I restriction enzyme M protein
VTLDGREEVLPLEEALVELAEAEDERREADAELAALLAKLGVQGYGDGG